LTDGAGWNIIAAEGSDELMDNDAESSESSEEGAHNELGEVHACDCGGANLIMGPVTLHFAPEEVPELFDLVSVAMEWVSQRDHEGKTGEPRGPRSKAIGIVH
jgi:hypothetical protein